MRLVDLIRRQPQFLLIAPEGIEMCPSQHANRADLSLLIAPEGIEIIIRFNYNRVVVILLIAPEGIEISSYKFLPIYE